MASIGVVRKSPQTPFAGYTSTSIDITEQKQFSEQLEKKVKERTTELAEVNLKLQQSNAELNEFAYIASHDLQEPIRKVRTFAELLQKNLTANPDKLLSYIEKIKRSSLRMQDLIAGVLKYSLLSKEKAFFIDVDLNDLVQSTLEDLELLIEQKQPDIQIEPLPIIEANYIQLQQLFYNLIANSIKFSIPGRPIQIFISGHLLSQEEVSKFAELNVTRQHYRVVVKDNGIGFSEENAVKFLQSSSGYMPEQNMKAQE